MRKRNFEKDDKGQAFSLDVMMALIIITMILGISADSMDLVSYKTHGYSSRFSLERATTDAADILIKSSGSPDEWEKYEFNYGMVPGLAKKEMGKVIPNTLSFQKISKLKSNYDGFMHGKVLPDGVNSCMIIYPANPSLSPIIVMNNTVPTSASEVAVANRTVLYDFMYTNVVIGMNTHSSPPWPLKSGHGPEICPHLDHEPPDFHNGKPGHACHHFNITIYDLNSTDFYVITDPTSVTSSARWSIDRADAQINREEGFSNGPILVNDKVMAAMGNDTKAVLWFHISTSGDPKDSFDSYIVGVPKGTPIDQVNLNYINPQPYFFVLWVWY